MYFSPHCFTFSFFPCLFPLLLTVQCNATLSAMEDVVESPDPASTSSFSPLECTYSITVYAGYGVEIQVRCISPVIPFNIHLFKYIFPLSILMMSLIYVYWLMPFH